WCAFAYLLTGKSEYAGRAKDEMHAALAEPLWDDDGGRLESATVVGEVCFGVGVGYDWLYEALSEDEREEMRTGLVARALGRYVSAVGDGPEWLRGPGTRNAVVNGGCGVAAMALLGEWEGAEECLESAAENLDVFLDAIPGDGGWAEGVGHWRYGMHYAMCFAAALRGVGRSDDEIILRDGVRNTGYFPIYFTAPDGDPADFGERLPDAPDMAVLHYLGMRTGRREFGNWRRRRRPTRAHPCDLVWSRPMGAAELGLPMSAAFFDTGWAALRSSWEDEAALYVAIRSGDLKATRGHRGLNSFILVAGGERFVIDAAASEPERASTRAHNCVAITGGGQYAEAVGRITDFFSSPQYASVVADAGEAYGNAASVVRRHFVMLGEGADAYLVMLDEVEPRREAEVEWLLHTGGPVTTDGTQARMCGEEGDLLASVLLPEGAAMEVREEPDRHVLLGMRARAGLLRVLTALQPVAKGAPGAALRAMGGDEYCGVRVERDGSTDWLLVRTGQEDEVEAEGVYFQGQKAFARMREDGGLECAVLENGVSLAVERQLLLGAERAVSAAVDLSRRESDGIVRARCWASGPTGLSLSVWGYPDEVRVNRSQVEIDAVGGMVSVVLEREGDHQVEIRLEGS
ncbi:MAG: heparinase II/III family protein, partial [Armatimonadota bacterium]